MALALAVWEQRWKDDRPWAGPEPWLSRDVAAQMERSAAQLDRLWGPGAAARWLHGTIGRSEGWTDGVRPDEVSEATIRGNGRRRQKARRIQSLAFFANALKVTARDAAAKRRGRVAPKGWQSRRPGGRQGWVE